MKTIFKKSMLTTLCTLTLLVGNGSISGMQDKQQKSKLSMLKDKIKSYVYPKLSKGDEMFFHLKMCEFGQKPRVRTVHPETLDCYSNNSENFITSSQYYGPISLIYNTLFKNQLKTKKENRDHKSPQYVQQEVLRYAQIMRPQNSIFNRFTLWYLKTCGFLTVYNGPEKKEPRAFEDCPGAEAYSHPYGGIYLPQGSLGSQLSAKQRCVLTHEIGHHVNGDTTVSVEFKFPGMPEWFKPEYLAQKRSLETLYQDKDYEAITEEYKVRNGLRSRVYMSLNGITNNPYRYGFLDTLESLIKQNPDDKQLQALHKVTNNTQQPTWESRYQEFIQTIKNKTK